MSNRALGGGVDDAGPRAAARRASLPRRAPAAPRA